MTPEQRFAARDARIALRKKVSPAGALNDENFTRAVALQVAALLPAAVASFLQQRDNADRPALAALGVELDDDRARKALDTARAEAALAGAPHSPHDLGDDTHESAPGGAGAAG